MNTDRRQNTRYLRHNSVVLQVTIKNESGNLVKIECRTEDISMGGIRVVVYEKLPIGLISELCIDSPKGQSMLLYAELKWEKIISDGFEYGFEFLDAEQSDIDHWIQQIEEQD